TSSVGSFGQRPGGAIGYGRAPRLAADGLVVLDRSECRPRCRGGRPRRRGGRRGAHRPPGVRTGRHPGRRRARLRDRRVAARWLGRRRRRSGRGAAGTAGRRAGRRRRPSPRWNARRHRDARRRRCARRGGGRVDPGRRLPGGTGAAGPGGAPAASPARALRGPADARAGRVARRMPRKLVLIVVDGMSPAAFERAVEGGRAPAMSFLAANGEYRQGTSVFPSLTPVCLSSTATGAGPGVHHIPSLVWWSRRERRIVEYGSSFAALRAAGLTQSLLDPIFNMNARHLSPDAVTIYEALEAAGLVTGAVNITCYRGPHRYLPTLPGFGRPAYGPSRFFFYGLFESDRTGAPFAVRSRRAGSVDVYAAAVGRWLVTRDGFDFLAFYLSGYDFASHAAGPDGEEADRALEQVDAAIRTLLDAAGGPDEFLERYAVVLLSDHGQTPVDRVARLQEPFADLADDVVVTATNRAGQVYLLPDARVDAAELARRLDGFPAVDVTIRREGDEAIARRAGADAPVEKLDHPDAAWRVRSALANPNAGELLVSAAEGWEFADLGGHHHAHGGSHGSLVAGDSFVPLVTVGVRAEPRRITDVAPAILEHFGVAVPAAMEAV